MLAAAMLSLVHVTAATYNWNTTNGVWDTSTANWTGGGATWVDGTGNTANFNNAAAGTVGSPLTITNGGSRTAGTITIGSTANNNANFSFTGVGSISASSFTMQGNSGNGPTYASNPSMTANVPTVSIAGDMSVGRANLNILGGNFSANRIISAAGGGAADWADVIISGGTVYVTNGVVGNANTTATFQLDLNGGTLYTPSLTVADRESGGNAWLNWNGGTVVATANTATFVTTYGGGITNYIGNGGAIINTFDGTTAHSITITPILKPATSSTGGLTKLGAGTLTLAGADTYTGATTISAGTLTLSSAGSIASTTNITVASGATFDVSAKTGYTLFTNQVLNGSGIINGSLTATNGAKVYAGGDATGIYATNTFNNNFTNTAGAAIYLDLGLAFNGSNDLITVAGTLNLNNTVFHLKAPNTSASLDTSSDYVLASAAAVSGSPNAFPVWDVLPVNGGKYFITTTATKVLLHFVNTDGPTAGATASNTSLFVGSTTIITVTVTNGLSSASTTNVTLNASPIGASSAVTLVQANGTTAGTDGYQVYTNTVTAASGMGFGSLPLVTTVIDGAGIRTYPVVYVSNRNLNWNNSAATGNWSTNAGDANWTGLVWNNTNPDNAVFTTVGGVINLTTPITAGTLTYGSTSLNPTNAIFNGSSLTTATNFTMQGSSANGGAFTNNPNPTLTNNTSTLSIGGDLAVGRMNFTTIGGNVSANRIISAAGSGAADWAYVTIAGGTVRATNGVVGNANTTATFELDLNGGTLYAPFLIVADREQGVSGNAVLMLNGGTVVATADTNAFVTVYGGNQNIFIGGGGAIINTFDGTTAHNITIAPILKPASALLAGLSGTGGLTKLGAGTLTLSNANTYIGGTTISAGTLALGSAGSIASTTNITIASGATFDVSAKIGFTISNQVLNGSGVINGSVTATNGAKVYAGGDATGIYATNTFNNNFTNATGAAIYMDLGLVSNGSKDLITVGGTLALNSTVFHVKAPSASVNLDTNDYVLVSAATISGSPFTVPTWDVSPLNAGNYTITNTGTKVVLHYVPFNPPTISATASPTNLVVGQTTVITATVTNGSSLTVSSVVVSGGAIAGSPVTLQSAGGNVYTNTVTIGSGAVYGNQALTVTVIDGNALSGSANVTLFVHVPRNLVWNNGAATGNWNTNDANWTGFIWDNLSPDNAAFTTVAGIVNLTTPITAGAVTFGTTGANIPNGTFANGSLKATSLTVQGSAANNGSSGVSTYSLSPTLTVNVPTVSIAGDVAVGRANLNIASGSFSANRIISAVGSPDWTDVIISGGTVYVTNGVVGNANTTATFQLDLNGGTLYTPSLTVADREAAQNGPATLNWNGGTVVATANTSTFVTLYGGSQNTYVGNGGAIINTFDGTSAHSITITPNLLPAASSTGGLTKIGTGTLTLAGVNSYIGNTTISNGTLTLASSGSISNTASITVASGATFDVSAVSGFTLGASQVLLGGGTNNGSVNTTSGTKVYAGGDATGIYATNAFKNNLTLASGSACYLDLGNVFNGSNDLIRVSGNLTNNGTVIHLKSPSTSGNLDSSDYTLFTVTGTISGIFSATPLWDVQPANAAHYTLVTSGNAVTLHYTANLPPSGGGSVSPANVTRNQNITISVTATNGGNPINTVLVDVSSISASSPVQLFMDGTTTNVYTNTVTVSAGTTTGSKTLTAYVIDTVPLTNSFAIGGLTVITANDVWNGGGGDSNWSTNPNWTNNAAPGYMGDTLQFAGNTQTTDNMDTNYSVAGLQFDSTAGSFIISSANNNTLTLTGAGVTNNSANAQTLNMSISMSAAQTLNAAAGALTLGGNIANGGNLITVAGVSNTVISGVISGVGGLTKTGTGQLTLAGNNSFTGSLLVRTGTVMLSGQVNNTSFDDVGNAGTDSAALIVDGTTGGSLTESSDFNVGDSDASSGTLTVQNGGNLNLSTFYVGSAFNSGSTATGIVYQTSGTVIQIATGIGSFVIGGRNFAGTGIYNLSGGVLTANGNVRIGANGTGTFNHTNGIFNAMLGINLARFSGGSGIYNLNGGTLAAFNIASSTGVNSIFNFNGGTLQAAFAPASNFMSGLSQANINAGGAIIDTVTNNITINQALLNGGGGGGLTKRGNGTLTLTAVSTYTGNTTISAGTLALGGSGSITNTTLISVTNGAVFDVSGLSSPFVLGASQTLSNNAASTGVINGNADTSAGIISVSYTNGTPSLSITNGTLTLASGMTFKIGNTGSALAAGSYKIISKATTGNAGAVAGTLPSVTVTGGAAPAVALQIINGELYLNAGTTTVGLISSAQTNAHNSSITFTATVQTNGVTAGLATGIVQFVTNGVAFGGPVNVAAGIASTNLSTLPRGTNLITAIYSGDANYLSSSNSLNQIITNNPPVAMTMTVTRTAGLALIISLTDMATNWSDVDGDPVELTGVNMQSTNVINLVALNWSTNLDGSIVTTNTYAYLGYTNSPNVADQISYSISDSQGGTNIGYVNIVIQGSVTGTNSITAYNFTSPNSNTVTAYGIPYFYYILERSTNLALPVWVDVQTNQAAPNGVINMVDQFIDLGGIRPSPAFYQLKWQP